MNIGIVQSSPVFGEVAGNLSDCFDLMSSRAADLWVLPELFATGYQFLNAAETRELAERIPSGMTTQALIAYAAENECFVVAGLPEIDSDEVYNASVLVGPDGFLARYRKGEDPFHARRFAVRCH